MSVDRQKDLVTIMGTMDTKALAKILKEKLKRSVEIVPPKKENDNKESDGGEDNKGNSKNGNGGKKNKGKGGDSGGAEGDGNVYLLRFFY